VVETIKAMCLGPHERNQRLVFASNFLSSGDNPNPSIPVVELNPSIPLVTVPANLKPSTLNPDPYSLIPDF